MSWAPNEREKHCIDKIISLTANALEGGLETKQVYLAKLKLLRKELKHIGKAKHEKADLGG